MKKGGGVGEGGSDFNDKDSNLRDKIDNLIKDYKE